MAVSVKEKCEGRASSQGADWRRTYTRVFQVLAPADVGSKGVREAVPVAIGDPYAFESESDSAAFCNSIDATCDKQMPNGASWTVTVTYGPFDPAIRPQNPLDEQPEIAWGWAPFQRAVFEDRDGNAIVNTAGDPFDPPIEDDDDRPVLGLVRNEASYDPLLAYYYKNAVNDATFFGAAAGKVKCASITPKRVYSADAGGYYWIVTYEFQFNPDGWTRRVLNQGFRELNGLGDQAPIYKDGTPVKTPALLGLTGQELPVGADPVFLEFELRPERDFSAFGFDAFYALLTS